MSGINLVGDNAIRTMDLLRVRQLINQPRRLPYRLKHRLSLFDCIRYQPVFVLK